MVTVIITTTNNLGFFFLFRIIKQSLILIFWSFLALVYIIDEKPQKAILIFKIVWKITFYIMFHVARNYQFITTSEVLKVKLISNKKKDRFSGLQEQKCSCFFFEKKKLNWLYLIKNIQSFKQKKKQKKTF